MADSLEWYYRRGDERGGPVGHEAMCRMVAERSMPLDTKVWREGFDRFVPASALPGFADAAAGKTDANTPATPPATTADGAGAAPLTAIMTDPWSPSPEALARLDAEAAAASPEPISVSRMGFEGGQLVRERGADDPPAGVSQARPLVRFWARMLDGNVNGFLFVAALSAGLPVPRTASQMGLLVAALLVVNALWLSACGTTPGKWLLGVRVRGLEGGTPGFAEALFREVAILIKGYGLGVFAPLTGAMAYGRLLNRGATSWDENGGFIVRHDRVGGARALLAAVFIIGATVGLRQPLAAAQVELRQNYQRLAAGGDAKDAPMAPAPGSGTATITRTDGRPTAPPPRKAPPRKIVM